ncbi:TIGR04255 family protein [Corallococcus sp. AB049A]|uniref:TIGR04255 family protein n=1 Tax=Corallococcus sp. AB049A TaxID=2316721 RepID=UPI000EA0EC1C|nr:TIGR04255 family protein [Corallococcus sp. AB049A]RKH49448.1 TIGR04255 family protein [Corallococcus sp. AB050B]RKI70327.1 TIGR04255 family protein [Corallococcus sp. AB049A]
MSNAWDPLVASPPKEVPLRDAPLVRVIAQLRFPEILRVEQRDFIAPFQEALRAIYPVLRQGQAQEMLFDLHTPGVLSEKQRIVWRFSDVEDNWRVSLASDFLALETTKYTSRLDFLARLRTTVDAVAVHLAPKLIDRIGVRYIDRIIGSDVDNIAKLVHPEVRGIIGSAVATHAAHTISESLFRLSDSQVLARWGQLPPGATIDPAAIEPAKEKSWILDLDMFSTAPLPFSTEQVLSNVQRYAERIYTLFRWAVTDDFLRRYGGTP